ncbi:alkene reductase [Nocardioides bruguierae]|uniref:alkene reductase n=1 Tax=Nocardioides bruguierae TaxID=2945102 RepID=UPI002020A955|nr:alkene reductase [Nocardioides bruguierae]MCL8024018.1 alkene reductase [Nocardioides bruguierae]
MTQLFESYDLAGLTLPNRVVMAPMSRVRATVDGLATPQMATYFAQRATAGLIVTDGVFPNAVGQSNPMIPGLATDAQADSWRQVADAVHTEGGRVFAQLMHGGRITHSSIHGLQPVGPSAVAGPGTTFTPTGPAPLEVPRALETAEVPEQAAAYGEAAARAVEAGLDGVELHGANGYLIGQFLSSNANLRTDLYGGSIENRVRFAVEATAGAVERIGGHRVGIRLSPDAGIWGVEETETRELYLALLEQLGALDLAYVHLEATADDGLLLDLRKAWDGTLLVNPVHPGRPQQANLEDAQKWLDNGADLISFGRAFIANPDLVERLRTGAPIATPDVETYYMGDERGYTDYPTHGA